VQIVIGSALVKWRFTKVKQVERYLDTYKAKGIKKRQINCLPSIASPKSRSS
jgi:hypothetical protein